MESRPWRLNRRFTELVRHFLLRFYDNDLISPDRDQLPALVNVVALLACPGILIPFLLLIKYSWVGNWPIWQRDLFSLSDKHLFLSIAIATAGLVTVLEWDALFPDRRDYLVLRPLPLSLRTIFLAKICALALFVAVFIGAAISLTPILFPAVAISGAPMAAVAWFGLCQLAATVAACLFTLFSLVALQGLLLNLLPYRAFRRVSPYVQYGLLSVVLMQFLLSGRAFAALNTLSARNPWYVFASPAMWFLGLCQYLLGWRRPVFLELSNLAGMALAGSALAAAVAYTLAYTRHVRRCLETEELQPAGTGPLRRLAGRLIDSLLLRHPVERAVFHFMAITLARSRMHRLYVGAYIGLGITFVSQILAATFTARNLDWLYRPGPPLASIPFALSLLLLVGLRHAYALPAELKANWVFRVAEPEDFGRVKRAVRWGTLFLGVLPVYVLLFPVYAAIWGLEKALLHSTVGITVALLSGEALLTGFRKIPFTCSYVPGRANVKNFWLAYLGGFFFLLSLLTGIELWVLAHPWGILLVVLPAAAYFRGRGYWRPREKPQLLFDDQPDPVVRELRIA